MEILESHLQRHIQTHKIELKELWLQSAKQLAAMAKKKCSEGVKLINKFHIKAELKENWAEERRGREVESEYKTRIIRCNSLSNICFLSFFAVVCSYITSIFYTESRLKCDKNKNFNNKIRRKS